MRYLAIFCVLLSTGCLGQGDYEISSVKKDTDPQRDVGYSHEDGGDADSESQYEDVDSFPDDHWDAVGEGASCYFGDSCKLIKVENRENGLFFHYKCEDRQRAWDVSEGRVERISWRCWKVACIHRDAWQKVCKEG